MSSSSGSIANLQNTAFITGNDRFYRIDIIKLSHLESKVYRQHTIGKYTFFFCTPALKADEQARAPSYSSFFPSAVLVFHMKRIPINGAKVRKVTDDVSLPPLLPLASLIWEQGDAAEMDTLR